MYRFAPSSGLGATDIASGAIDCFSKDTKIDKAKVKECAAAAASAAATAYCTANYGPQAGALCGTIASTIAGPVAGAMYDAGDALVTGISNLFGGGGGTECGCDRCFWGKCWSHLTELQRVHYCSMPEHRREWPTSALLVKAGTDCPQTLARESDSRVATITAVSNAYMTWVKDMVATLNRELLPRLAEVGKARPPFAADYIEGKLARFAVTGDNAKIARLVGDYERVGFVIREIGPHTIEVTTGATKGVKAGAFGWFVGTAWNAPVNVQLVRGDPNAIPRAIAWGNQLLMAQSAVSSDIIMDIAKVAATVKQKHADQAAQAALAAQKQSEERALFAGLLMLAAGAAGGVVVWRRRNK